MTRARVIGRAGGLPWRLPEDLRYFKATTLGHAVIMGRKTHASIGRPLPGRRNIVVSRGGPRFPGCEHARSVDEAIAVARASDPLPFIIGGASIYAAALPSATHLYVTDVLHEADGDTFFPDVDLSSWRETSARPGDGVVFRTYERT